MLQVIRKIEVLNVIIMAVWVTFEVNLVFHSKEDILINSKILVCYVINISVLEKSCKKFLK